MSSRLRAAAIGGIVVGIVVAAWWWRRPAADEVHSVPSTSEPVATQHTTPSQIPDSAGHLHPPAPQSAPAGNIGSGSAEPYPVNLDALRTRLPNNRYWALGAPTSDPVVAKARAERAERDNTALGRIQANDATPDEIRAYYAERRAISNDYLEIAQMVLLEQGAQLPDRDRGMFELSVNLHKARLLQIDRDESDALGRLAAREGLRDAPPDAAQ